MKPAHCLFGLSAALSLALAGCTVGPDFTRPAPPAAVAYRPAAEMRATPPGPQPRIASGPQVRWWEAFGSPAMNGLVERALARNLSLEAADATLTAALDETRAAAGRRLPQLSASARVEQQQINLAAAGFTLPPDLGFSSTPSFHLYSVGGGVSFDPDLFGGLRRQQEQAAAQAESQGRRADAAALTVAGRVVAQVLTIAALRKQIAVADALLADDRRNVDLTRRRREAGEGTLVEELNAEAQYTADRGSIPRLDQQLDEARHLLAILLGIAPTELEPTDFDLDTLILPRDVPVTMPSGLVRKRPDILQAEADLHAATAAIGVATARLYPDITLGASISQAAPAVSGLSRNSFRGYDIFAGLTAPIFSGGTLRAQRGAAVQRARAADATYRETVLEAFGQVADLLSALQNDARSVADQSQAADVAQRSLALSRRSFQVGNSGVLQVLDSERLFQRANTDLVLARTRQYLNVARLYVATAGGWRPPAAPTP